MKIESRLKELRLQKNMTQDELAANTGLSRSSISNWECDICSISVGNALKLCDYFNVTLNYLLGLSEEEYIKSFFEKLTKNINSDTLVEFLVKQLNNKK